MSSPRAGICLVPLSAQTKSVSQDQSLHINQLQFIGTHNSYHAGLAREEAAQLRRRRGFIPERSITGIPALDQQLWSKKMEVVSEKPQKILRFVSQSNRRRSPNRAGYLPHPQGGALLIRP